jgi:hypothetical protein
VAELLQSSKECILILQNTFVVDPVGYVVLVEAEVGLRVPADIHASHHVISIVCPTTDEVIIPLRLGDHLVFLLKIIHFTAFSNEVFPISRIFRVRSLELVEDLDWVLVRLRRMHTIIIVRNVQRFVGLRKRRR